MASSGKGGKQRGEGDDRESKLARALEHRVRRRLLRLLQASGDPHSPARLARALDVPPSSVGYHVKVLASFQTVKAVGDREARGSLDHSYVSAVDDDQTILALLEATRESDEA